MPTRVEEIVKKIHILFAKSEAYQNSPDLVVMSKNEMFTLLEQLNEAIYEVLDKYEATTRAKEKARLETERQASEIIAEAKKGAEDVQAASLTFTDSAIDELAALIDNTTQSIRTQYLEFLAAMDEKQEALKENRAQLKDSLAELNDNEAYLKVLEEVRAEREAEKEEERLREIEEGKEVETGDDADNAGASDSKTAEAVKTGNASASGKNTKSGNAGNNKKAGASASTGSNSSDSETYEDEYPAPPKAPEPVIRVNRPGENPGVVFTTKRSHKKGKKSGNHGNKPVAKQGMMTQEEFDRLSPEEQDALENSTPAYGEGFTADDFNLDAEYEQFKQEQPKAEEEIKEQPKGFFSRLFGKLVK
ncbi:MAG: hypothetical protein J5783_04445 [Lachnospiraceae bacterium]|nr:hypothetical protein [Lachnospiraceae bacterium]